MLLILVSQNSDIKVTANLFNMRSISNYVHE